MVSAVDSCCRNICFLDWKYTIYIYIYIYMKGIMHSVFPQVSLYQPEFLVCGSIKFEIMFSSHFSCIYKNM
jgi:hypothetical protein